LFLILFACPTTQPDSASEWREQAVKAVNPLDREARLRVAEEWLKLGTSVDERRREGPLG
jgi:hypothetical protein